MDNKSIVHVISVNRGTGSYWHKLKKRKPKNFEKNCELPLVANLLSNILSVMKLKNMSRESLILEILEAHSFSQIPLGKHEFPNFRTRDY